MTNETIPNVPRELTIERDVFGAMHIKLGDFDFIQIQYQYPYTDNAGTKALAERIAALLSAPSPAGVDGLEVIGWYTDDHLDDKSATTYSRKVADRWLAKGWPVNGIANAAAAQAIIDGLRGEVGAQRVKTCIALKERNDARTERDQQAQRIGELEGLLREAYKYPLNHACETVDFTAQDLCERIDAALSAGKEGE